MNKLTTCTSPSGDDSVSQKCQAHPLAAVVPQDWKKFVEACAEVENCTVNISAIARRAKKLLRGADSGQVQPMAVPDGWKLVPIEPTEQMVLAPGAIHTAGKVARIHRDVWARMLDAAPTAPAAQDDAKDAERWREVLMHVGATVTGDIGARFTLSFLEPVEGTDLMRGSVAGHFTEAIDAAIAAKRTGP